MNKKELRQEIRNRKKIYSKEDLDNFSTNITRTLENHPRFSKAQNILMYYSLDDEVSTHRFIEKWKNIKNIILPVVIGENMILKQYKGNLSIGPYNILEPEGKEWKNIKDIELAIVPGMAFDIKGNRLGRGKGYYDKTLCNLNCYKIGICFPFQLFENIPFEKHDIKMDEIISK